MDLKLYNTHTREASVIAPQEGSKVLGYYCCGPTVYGPAHIGNFRTFVLQDVFRRTVEALGLKVKHVRNVTDVDDKTIRGAVAEGADLESFTSRWLEQFEADCVALNMLRPHIAPSAVAHIQEQIELIEKLIEKNLAYRTEEGSVYFRIAGFKAYGRLSRLNIEGMRSNADQRLNDADEYEKETLNDFALWKAWKPEDGDVGWDSPWGRGRPGWHLECSAMSMKYLGEVIDVHAGGVDLIFPHHENEIAQSCGATGNDHFVRHWFHSYHLQVEGEKMSKSLGNLYTLDDLRGWGHTNAEVRYLLLSGYYRRVLNFTRSSLGAARSALRRMAEIASQLSLPKKVKADPTGESWGRFCGVLEGLCDDLNTPKALAAMHAGLGQLEKALPSLSNDEKVAEGRALRHVLNVLGIDLTEALEALEAENETVEAPPDVIALAEKRQAARAAKDWAEADAARDALTAAGWQVRDAADGYELIPKS